VESEIHADEEPEEIPEEIETIEPADIPEWLQSLEGEVEEPEIEAEPVTLVPEDERLEEEVESISEEIPEWLQSLEEEAEEPSIDAEPTAFVPEGERLEEEVEAISEEIPEWLKSLEEEAEEPSIVAEPTALIPEGEFLEEISETESEDILEWLESAEEGIQESEMETQPTVIVPFEPLSDEGVLVESDEIKEWLDSLEEGAQEPDIETEPTLIQPPPGKMEESVISEPTDIPEWLEGMVSDEFELPSAEEPDLVAETEMTAEPADIPEWLEELTFEETETPSAEEPEEIIAAPDVEFPERITTSKYQEEIELEEIEVPEEVVGEKERLPEGDLAEKPDFEDAEAAMAWLDALALEDSITDEELLIRPPEFPEVPAEDLRLEEEKVDEVEVEQLQDFEPEKYVPEVELEWLAGSEEAVGVEMGLPESQPDEGESDILFEDADEALAWLEGLAAKQGVSEDELITSPEDRLELPPDWVQQEIVEEMEESPAELEGLEGTEPVVEIPDWLKEAIESEEIEALITPDLETGPQEEPEGVGISADLPEFLEEAVDFKKQDILEGQLESVPQPMIVEEEIEPEPAPEIIPDEILKSYREEAIEITEHTEDDFRTIISEDEGMPEAVISQDEASEMPLEAELPPKEELGELEEEVVIEPIEWEKEFERTKDEDYQWVSAEIEEIPTVSTELLELNEASLKQLERLPLLGFQGAQAIVTYRDEHGPFGDLEDLLKVPGITEDAVNAIRSNIIVSPPAEPEPEPVTGALQPTPQITPSDKFHAIQLEAMKEFTGGNIEVALKKYSQLIKKGKRIDEVINDLEKVLSGDIPNEVCVDIYQVLGDAHLKADQLQEALDSYTKAEELLR
jgi:competence ComEA-like helix-hairpin-helix protein